MAADMKLDWRRWRAIDEIWNPWFCLDMPPTVTPSPVEISPTHITDCCSLELPTFHLRVLFEHDTVTAICPIEKWDHGMQHMARILEYLAYTTFLHYRDPVAVEVERRQENNHI